MTVVFSSKVGVSIAQIASIFYLSPLFNEEYCMDNGELGEAWQNTQSFVQS